MECQGPLNNPNTFQNEEERKLIIGKFKAYHKVPVILTLYYQNKDRHKHVEQNSEYKIKASHIESMDLW